MDISERATRLLSSSLNARDTEGGETIENLTDADTPSAVRRFFSSR